MDNQAAALFMKATQVLTSMQISPALMAAVPELTAPATAPMAADLELMKSTQVLSAMNTGPELINLQRQQNELGGGRAGGAPVNITDASTTISNQSQPLILPTLDIAPDNPENSRLTSG